MFEIVRSLPVFCMTCSPHFLALSSFMFLDSTVRSVLRVPNVMFQLSASEDRIKVMNYYRVFGFIGRFVSAVVSIGFLFTPNIPIIPASSGSDVDGYCYIASFTLPPVRLSILSVLCESCKKSDVLDCVVRLCC